MSNRVHTICRLRCSSPLHHSQYNRHLFHLSLRSQSHPPHNNWKRTQKSPLPNSPLLFRLSRWQKRSLYRPLPKKTVTLPVVEMTDPEPDLADDDDEPEEKGFYRRGSRLRKFPEEFVVIDFETTGFSPIQNEIIEVGMLKVCGTDVVDSYQQLVRPKKPVSGRITKLTGITNEMLEEAPAAADIMPDVLDFIGDLPLVGHNVSFDVGFLVLNANLYCDGNAAFPSFDTMQCAKRELPFLPDYKLGTVANYFDCQDETAHRALADCHSTLGCFIGLMNYNE